MVALSGGGMHNHMPRGKSSLTTTLNKWAPEKAHTQMTPGYEVAVGGPTVGKEHREGSNQSCQVRGVTGQTAGGAL